MLERHKKLVADMSEKHILILELMLVGENAAQNVKTLELGRIFREHVKNVIEFDDHCLGDFDDEIGNGQDFVY